MALEIERTRYPRPNGYRATLGPLEVNRPTKTEARDALMTQVEQAIIGSFQPSFITYGGHCALIYRDAHGWCYLFSEGNQPNFLHGSTISHTQGTREHVILSARKHLAQTAWPDLNGLDLLAHDSGAILDHLHWVGFQRAYAYSVKMFPGRTDTGHHRHACDHSKDDDMLTADELAARDAARASLRPF